MQARGWPRLLQRQALIDALPLLLIVAVAALARTWHLQQNGFGRTYYATGVRSQMESWHNFLFNAFDPGGFITIDKPPVAIWMQVLSAEIFGFSEFSVLFAQVVLGLAAIVLLYLIVARSFSRSAGLAAALVLALLPVAIAVDRSNNTESCLIVVLLLAAWLGMRAAESGRLAPFCAAMAVLGIGFNVKMGAALVLAPVLALTFSIAQLPRPLKQALNWPIARWHVSRQFVAGVLLIIVSLSWAVFFDLTPADKRPFAGSTKGNSMLELALIHNGASRFLSMPQSMKRENAVPKTAAVSAAQTPPLAETKADDATAVPVEDATKGPDQGASVPAAKSQTKAPSKAVKGKKQAMPVLVDNSPTGPLRLFRPRAAAQFAWLLPIALAGLWLAFSSAGATRERSIAAGIFAGWLVSYWLVLSLAGGPVHTYYVAVLGPPLAAFAGIALAELRARWEQGALPRLAVSLLILATLVWQLYLCAAQTGFGLNAVGLIWMSALALAALAAGALVVVPPNTRAARALGVTAIGALLVAPSLTAASLVLRKPNVAAPVADMAVLLNTEDAARAELTASLVEEGREMLVDYLDANRGDTKWLVAVPNAVLAAPLITASGEPIMAMGGYLGDDPILTPDKLAAYVASGELRYVLLGGYTLAPEKAVALADIARFVRANGRPVPSRLWRIGGPQNGRPYRITLGDTRITVPPPVLYDLRR